MRAPVRSDPARTQTLRAQTLRAESAQAPTDDRPVVPPPGALPDEQDGAHPPIVVRGRHTAVSERFRQHVAEKLRGVEKFDHKIIRFDVESSTEANPRQSHARDRIEITCLSRGPVVRAEAAAQDPYAALDCAVAKLEERLRRSADRRHSRGARIARVPRQRPDALGVVPDLAHELDPPQPEAPVEGVLEGDEDGPFVVREKVHPATPMTLDEALASMELVGHDFYLFTDSACGTASVVYRRRGYHYGVLRLNGEAERAG